MGCAIPWVGAARGKNGSAARGANGLRRGAGGAPPFDPCYPWVMRWRTTIGIALLGLPTGCSGGAPAHVEAVPVQPPSPPTAAPAPSRREMAGEAALVWEIVPAKPSPSGPRDRDATITRFVVDKDGRAEVVA